MFTSKKQQKIDEVDTVIGPGTTFEGNIEAIGIVKVDGTLKGNIKTQGDVIVGEKGNVQGELSARNITIAGIAQGELIANGKLTIQATGKVIGDVIVDSIIIEEKSIFNGKCMMKSGTENQSKGVVNG